MASRPQPVSAMSRSGANAKQTSSRTKNELEKAKNQRLLPPRIRKIERDCARHRRRPGRQNVSASALGSLVAHLFILLLMRGRNKSSCPPSTTLSQRALVFIAILGPNVNRLRRKLASNPWTILTRTMDGELPHYQGLRPSCRVASLFRHWTCTQITSTTSQHWGLSSGSDHTSQTIA